MAFITPCFLKKIKAILASSLIFVPTIVSATDSGQILTSIKPLALIAREITDGSELKVDYLLPPTVSEHHYALRVSDAKKLREATLVIWLGPEMEPYLQSSLDTWAPARAGPAKSLSLLANMVFDDPVYEEESTSLRTVDPHIWLSPLLAQQVAKQVADRLAAVYPTDKRRFEDNLKRFSRKASTLDQATNELLEAHENKPFLVYHSAYGYFVKRYKLNQIGALHTQPGATMSLKQLNELQLIVGRQVQPVCLFREPQFKSAPVPAFQGVNTIQTGELDPLGINADSYEQLIENLARSFLLCFAQNEKG